MLESSIVGITGDFRADVLDIAGVAPQRIIRTTDPFRVHCEITINTGAIMLVPPEVWDIRLFMESVGPGNEVQVQIPPTAVNVTFNTTSYLVDINVPAGAVQGLTPANPALPATSSGLYTLAAVLTLRLGNNMLPIAGFSEVSFLQFYTP